MLKDLSLHKRLANYAIEDPVANRLLVCVEDCFQDAVNRTKSVIKHMPEYTLHDEVHLLRVVEIMGLLIPDTTLERLTALELGGLILSAAYHDIGMAPSDSEVRALLTTNASSTNEDSKRYLTVKESFPNLLKRQKWLRKSGKNFEAQEIESWFLIQHLRRTHAERARKLLLESYMTKMVYDYCQFAPRLAEVCFSHNEDASSLTAIDARELVRGGREYCNCDL